MKTYKLSDQALGALMMALQKCLVEQSDIVEILNEFNYIVDDTEKLVVENPPNFKIQSDQELREGE